MVVNVRSLKRMKRRVTAETHDFLSFPAPDSGERIAGSPFRSNVKAFLERHARLPSTSRLLPHLLTWQVLFRAGDSVPESAVDVNSSGGVVYLDVVEEDVARSRSVYCDQCRVVGWSGHPVCTKRYHFIVKADGNSIGGDVKHCPKCGDGVLLADPRCKTCNHVMTSEDVEDWIYHQLEGTTHLLHGVVHANGYGHLLRINGREGGSRVFSGTDIMNFWDRLCKYLGVRKISVMDVSKKYGLEYRLIHAITEGHPWYGNWGYEFGSGSFGLTQEAYKEAVETLSNMPLSYFICQGRKPHTRIQELILFYKSLSERELVNIRDLFLFVMSLIHDVQKSAIVSEDTFQKRQSCAPGILCAWTTSDIKRVEVAMMRVLRAVTGSNWVSWRTLRGAVCKAGPPELLDYCLKELGGKQTPDGMTIHARCNPDTGALEYRVESGNFPVCENIGCAKPSFLYCPSREQILRDISFMYECLLHPQMNFGQDGKKGYHPVLRLLDCKQFVKNYKPETMLSLQNTSAIYLFCQVELRDHLSEEQVGPPPELIALSPSATISDLKFEASKAFQEVYIMFKGFQAEAFVDYRGVEGSTQVKHLFPSLTTLKIQGRCPLKNWLGQFCLERGMERWTVECSCGARDDDGERMLACDVCGVWQHTRCLGIRDFEAVPAKFLCLGCGGTGGMALVAAKIGVPCKDLSLVLTTGARGGGGKSMAMFNVR